MEKTSSRTKCQEIESQKEKRKRRTKLSRLRATPVNALRASLRNAFAIIVLCFLLLLLLRFTSRICAASFLIMCRINLSRVRWRRDAFPLEKKEERFIFQKMNFFARRARARRDTCVFPKFLTEREILISRLVGQVLFRVNFSSSHARSSQAVYPSIHPSLGKRDASSDTAQHFDAFFARARVYI